MSGKIEGIPCPKPVKSSSKANKKRAYQMEVREAKRATDAGIPAKRVPLSGALKGVGLDGDIDVGTMILGWLEECKSYTAVEANGAKYVRFDIGWLDKVMEEGKLHGKPGIVCMQPKGAHNAFMVVDRDQFKGLMGRAYRALYGTDPV